MIFRRRPLQFLMTLLAFLGVTTAFAATPSSEAPSTKPNPSPLPADHLMCPPISALQKDPQTMIWFAKSGWRSFSTSFADHLSTFIGAQWQGVNVGNIACLYRSDDKSTFPVVLQFSRLVYTPSGGKWGKNLGGYSNCLSHHRHDCLFKPEPKKKPGDIYETVRHLKGSSPQELGF